MDFSKEFITKNFTHDNWTGKIFRNRGNREVQTKDKDGYIVVHSTYEYGKVGRMRGARLVWTLYNGEIPAGMVIDHINRVRDDNRIENLRLANTKQNSFNADKADTSSYTSRFKGVQKDRWGRWLATIFSEGKTDVLGKYDIEEAAAYAYNVEAIKRYGEFALLNDVPEINLEKYTTVRTRDFLSEERRGLPKGLILYGSKYLFRVSGDVIAWFCLEHKEDAVSFAKEFNKSGKALDFKTDRFKYNKFGLPYNIFPCSTGYRVSFVHNYKRHHVGTFRDIETACEALLKKQKEVCDG